MTPLLTDYFARIGYTGDRAPHLEVLARLAGHHLRAIPFESLDPLLRRGVSLAPDALVAKLVKSRRGGYCFEHNGLFCDVLGAVGFAVTPLAARVIWMMPPDAPTSALTHRLTRVDIAGETFIVDVGFGGQSPPTPLRLVAHSEQTTSHGAYRLVPYGASVELQMRTTDGFAGMYRFTLTPSVPADYEMGNWYTSTYPQGRFTQNLIAAIIDDGGRWTLMNRTFSRRHIDGQVEERTLATAADLHQVLTETFHIDPPTDAETIWNRLPPLG